MLKKRMDTLSTNIGQVAKDGKIGKIRFIIFITHGDERRMIQVIGEEGIKILTRLRSRENQKEIVIIVRLNAVDMIRMQERFDIMFEIMMKRNVILKNGCFDDG